MEFIRTGTRRYIDLCATATSELGRIGTCLDLEFLNSFRGDRDSVLVDGEIVVINSVQEEVVRRLARPVDGNGSSLPLVLRSLHALIGTGNQQIELQKVTAVQRKFCDVLMIDDVPHRGGVSRDDRSTGFDHHLFAHLTHLHRDVSTQPLVYLQGKSRTL